MSELYKEHHELLRSIYVPKTIAQIVVDVSMIDDFSRKVMILEFHMQALEEEMKLSSASKHPLYYSFHFLEDAIEILKQEILRCKRRGENPVVGELRPVKSGFEECLVAKGSKDINEKKEWMSSVQLCTSPVQYHKNVDSNNQDSLLHRKSSFEGYQASWSGDNFSHKVGAFMTSVSATMKNKGIDPVSSPPAIESEITPTDLNEKRKNLQPSKPSYPQPLQKKPRRCWSPELHKQFVDALQRLGGIESATPKHIREVMNVKGLTNDEIKSHLQKYRLYTRKLPSSARQLSYSWLTRENQRGGGAPMPVVVYPGTLQITNLHLAEGWVQRVRNDVGSSTERAKDHGKHTICDHT